MSMYSMNYTTEDNWRACYSGRDELMVLKQEPWASLVKAGEIVVSEDRSPHMPASYRYVLLKDHSLEEPLHHQAFLRAQAAYQRRREAKAAKAAKAAAVEPEPQSYTLN